MIISPTPKNVISSRPLSCGMFGSENFRIPGISVTESGRIAMCSDVRWNEEQDCGGIDTACSVKNADGTWLSSFAAYLGDNGNVFNVMSTSIMDPEILCRGERIYILCDLFPQGLSTQHNNFSCGKSFTDDGKLMLSHDGEFGYYLSDGRIYSLTGDEVRGLAVDEHFFIIKDGKAVSNLFFSDAEYRVHPSAYLALVHSDDYGRTWSGFRLINLRREDEDFAGTGCGHGIVTTDGDIIFCCYTRKNAFLAVSHDGGQSFERIDSGCGISESRCIELDDGTLIMFGRSFHDNIVYTTFSHVNGTYVPSGKLTQTGVECCSNCNLSAVRYGKYILISSPSVKSTWQGRYGGKIYVFELTCGTDIKYSHAYFLNGDSDFFAYSDMAVTGDTLHIAYEDSCMNYMNSPHGSGKSGFVYREIPIKDIVG